MSINYTPSKTCREFMLDDSFFRALMGPIGGGKSVACVMEILRRCIAQPKSPDGFRRSRWAVVRNCYDDQTEILTELRGWVLFKDLTPDDKVATRVDGKLTFETPSYYYSAPYKGRMVTINSEDVDLCVTPDHELWVSTRTTRKKIWGEYSHIRAQDIEGKGETYRMTAVAGWDGVDTTDSELWYEFLGFWFAQGSASVIPRKDCRGDHYRLNLTHRDTDAEYVVDMLDRLGWGYGVSPKPGCTTYVLSAAAECDKEIVRELVSYGKALTKSIPAYIKNAPQGHIQAFLRGFQRGDGSHKTGAHDVDRLYTSSPKLANDLHEMVVKSGRACRLTSRPAVKDAKMFDKLYDRAEQFILTIRQPKRENPLLRCEFWGEQQYDGTVYCVTVSSHVVLVRRGGKALWCGQTRPQLKDTTVRTWFQWIPDGVLGRWKESEMNFYLKFGDVDAEIFFRPLDTPADVQRVLSLELTGCWVNEAREMPIEILTALQGRLRRYPRREEVPDYWSGIIADTNPPEIDSTWYNIFEHLPQKEDEPESVLECASFIQPSGLSPEAENLEYLAQDYYTALARGKTEEWINVYLHGRYAKSQAGKPVYTKQFKYDKHISRTPLKANPNLPIIIGHDFGRTPAALFMQQQLDGRIFILREAVGFDIGLQTFNTKFTRPLLNNYFKGYTGVFVGDPAGIRQSDTDDNTCFKELKTAFPRTAGFHVKAAHTNDPIVRINALGEVLSQFPDGDPLILIDPSCKWFIEGLRSKYKYAKKQGQESYHDKPDKNNWSHIVEAGQYGVMFLNTKYSATDYKVVTRTAPMFPFTTDKPSYGTYAGY